VVKFAGEASGCSGGEGTGHHPVEASDCSHHRVLVVMLLGLFRLSRHESACYQEHQDSTAKGEKKVFVADEDWTQPQVELG